VYYFYIILFRLEFDCSEDLLPLVRLEKEEEEDLQSFWTHSSARGKKRVQ
jgi:hypothetical protein